jgi:imidazolonepropionase-like amidohydrolase
MAHAHSAEGIKLAIKCGVRSIEHASFIDEEAFQLIEQRNSSSSPCWIVPTLFIGDFYAFEYQKKSKPTPTSSTSSSSSSSQEETGTEKRNHKKLPGKLVSLRDETEELHRKCISEVIRRSARSNNRGIRVAVGSDYVGWDCKLNARELECLVELGMTPMNAIKAATSSAAQLLRR